jgi:hypothetical protein
VKHEHIYRALGAIPAVVASEDAETPQTATDFDSGPRGSVATPPTTPSKRTTRRSSNSSRRPGAGLAGWWGP